MIISLKYIYQCYSLEFFKIPNSYKGSNFFLNL